MCVLNKRGKVDFTVGNIYIYIFTNISEGTAFHWPSFFRVLHSMCRAVFILTPPPYTINFETKRKRIAETRAREGFNIVNVGKELKLKCPTCKS